MFDAHTPVTVPQRRTCSGYKTISQGGVELIFFQENGAVLSDTAKMATTKQTWISGATTHPLVDHNMGQTASVA